MHADSQGVVRDTPLSQTCGVTQSLMGLELAERGLRVVMAERANRMMVAMIPRPRHKCPQERICRDCRRFRTFLALAAGIGILYTPNFCIRIVHAMTDYNACLRKADPWWRRLATGVIPGLSETLSGSDVLKLLASAKFFYSSYKRTYRTHACFKL